ncbi:hypothetical protein AB1L07_08005 [Niallia alba]|uniref:hypothetical protein n=1 Tax=Niallia alba TaxID=2729105 RepID=UPI0028FE14AB|nr:hypothetical protein [Niallia nealsonii]
MQKFIVIFLSMTITSIVINVITSITGFEYNWFRDAFNLGHLLLDLLLFMAVYTLIFALLTKMNIGSKN